MGWFKKHLNLTWLIVALIPSASMMVMPPGVPGLWILVPILWSILYITAVIWVLLQKGRGIGAMLIAFIIWPLNPITVDNLKQKQLLADALKIKEN